LAPYSWLNARYAIEADDESIAHLCEEPRRDFSIEE
jgi:hypothetical protein